MKKSFERRIRRIEAIINEEQKPIVLKVHGLAIGVTTTTKQEKDHGPVDK